MKILSLLFLCASLLLANNLNATQEPPELQEAATLYDSAVKLYDEGKYNGAVPLAKRALEIREKLLPPNDIRVSTSLTSLGKIYVANKDYKLARAVFQRLLDIQEKQFGPENLRLAETLEWLGMLHYQAENSRESEASYKRALAIREKGFGSNHAEVARSLFALAQFYRAERRLQPAVETYTRALTLYGQLGGTDSPDFRQVSEAFSCLGYTHNKPELFKQVHAIWQQFASQEAREPEYGQVLNGRAISLPRPDYPDGARSLRLSGTVVVKVLIDEQGKVIKAEDMCQGPPYLSEASVAAAFKARFTPTKLSGMPVRVNGIIQYNFVHQ
jgi:TonB family protein